MSLTDFIDPEDMDDESEFDSSDSDADTSDDDSEFEPPTMWSSATQWGSYRDAGDDVDEDNS